MMGDEVSEFRAEKEFHYERVAVGTVNYDREHYQRPHPTAGELRKFDPWNQAAAGTPVLSRRQDRSLWGIDGQRRLLHLSMTKGPDFEFECKVYCGLSIAEEAALYRQFDERTQQTPYDRFKAAVTAGNPTECAVLQICRDLGLEISRAGSTHPRTLNAVERLLGVYKSRGGEHLRRTLVALRDGFQGYDGAFHTTAIDGMSQFLVRYPSVSEERLKSVLQQLGPDRLVGSARLYQQNLKDPAGRAWGKALRNHYCKGLRSGRLEDWQDRVFTA
jgi:hypothetical protein